MKRSVVTASAFAAIGFAILCGLGSWQLERLQWKEKLIADLNERLSDIPQALPASPSQVDDEYRRVKLRVEFIPNEYALVYTPGSALRPDANSPSYWVMAPAKTERGIVVVNRGWLHPQARDKIGPPQPGEIEIVGVLRWPEDGNLFLPRDEPMNNMWYRRDPAAIAAAKNWGTVAPFYVEQESPQGLIATLMGWPRSGRIIVKLPNNHLQYAITWFGLAGALAAVYLAWLRNYLRRVRSR